MINSIQANLIALFLVYCQLCACIPLRVPDHTEQQQALELIDRGVACLRQGDFEHAKAAFQLSRELVYSAAASDGLGCVAFLRGEHVLAESLFMEALDYDFSYTQAQANLALLYEQTGRMDQAHEQYLNALQNAPGNFRLRNNYAIFLMQNRNEDIQEVHSQLIQASMLESDPIIESNMLQLFKRGE